MGVGGHERKRRDGGPLGQVRQPAMPFKSKGASDDAGQRATADAGRVTNHEPTIARNGKNRKNQRLTPPEVCCLAIEQEHQNRKTLRFFLPWYKSAPFGSGFPVSFAPLIDHQNALFLTPDNCAKSASVFTTNRQHASAPAEACILTRYRSGCAVRAVATEGTER